MTGDDRDPRLEELLRAALSGEANDVQPRGDGLARIQERIRVRRSHRMWLRPLTAAAAVAVVGGAGVGAYAMTTQHHRDDSLLTAPTTPTPSTTPTSTPSPTRSRVATIVPFPAAAVFPFTTVAQERAWESGTAPAAYAGDPVATAQHLFTDMLGLPATDTVVVGSSVHPQTADVTLGRQASDAGTQRQVAIAVVHLARYGRAWLVVGADDAGRMLRVSTPVAGSAVGSPIAVTGPGYGVDETVDVQVRAAHSAGPLGSTGHATFGNGVKVWQASVTFSVPNPAPDAFAAVVVSERSAADGGLARLTLVPARLSPAQAPAYFYGVKNSRVTKFASRNGAAITYLTGTKPGGGPSDPQVVGTDVYFVRAYDACNNALVRVASTSVDGSAPEVTVTQPDSGYVITHYGIGDGKIALFEQACGSASPQAQIVVRNVGQPNVVHRIAFPALPPAIQSELALESPGAQPIADAVVRTGTQAYVARFNLATETSPTPSLRMCGQLSGLPQAVDVGPDGRTYVAVQTGPEMQVLRCTTTSATKVFAVPGTATPASLAMANGGSAALVTDTDGTVWRWDGSGSPSRLSTSVPVAQVTW